MIYMIPVRCTSTTSGTVKPLSKDEESKLFREGKMSEIWLQLLPFRDAARRFECNRDFNKEFAMTGVSEKHHTWNKHI
jgi:hypothetical protein